jgi:hypothetical protein
MDDGLGELKKQSQPAFTKTSPSPKLGFTKASSSPKLGFSKASSSPKLGFTKTSSSPLPGITKASSSSPPGISKANSFSPPGITQTSSSKTIQKKTPASKQEAPVPKQEPLTPSQEAFKSSMEPFSWSKFKRKINQEAANGNKPTPHPSVLANNLLAFITTMAAYGLNLIIYGGKVIMEETPKNVMKLFDEVTAELKAPMVESQSNKFPTKIKPNTRGITGGMTEGMTEDMTGGAIFTKANVKLTFNRMLFNTAYIPGILTLFAFLFLLFYLLWTLIVWAFNKILSFLGSNKQTLPSIKFNKKTTQTIYSIFFVITSWFLMLYLVIDYYRKLGSELDIVQILKQLIGALYILWPMLVLIIGSGIAKAFYKISCSGNKPNVLSWAKIVESSALYVLGICVLITVILLFKPINWIYKKVFPNILKDKFTNVTNLLAVTLKLMVIYILLRMITIMIEDVISNKIVFFISKFNKDVEAPPVDCNAVIEEKNAKQSEIAKILEEIYMYISGIIVCIIAIFILVIQCPHPYMASTSKINNTIGSVTLKLTGIATRFIVENKDRQVDCNEKNKGSGLFKTPNWFSSLGKTGQQSDSTAAAYSSKFKEMAAAEKAGDASQAASQAADTSTVEAYTNKIKASASSYTSTAPPSTKTPTPPATAQVTRTKNGLGTTPADQTFHPRDTPTLSATKPLAQIASGKVTGQGIDTNGAFSGLASQVSGETANPVSWSYRDTTPNISEDDISTRRY